MIVYPVRFASIARRLPKRRVANTEAPFNAFADIHQAEAFWGIVARPVIDPAAGESELSLALTAAHAAIELAGIVPDEIDLVLANITSPLIGGVETIFPRISKLIADRLGLRDVLTNDIEVECASFLVQVQIACDYIRAGRARAVLVCSTESMSAILDYGSKSSIPFGDGAVCAVLTRDDSGTCGMVDSIYFSDGAHFELATVAWQEASATDGTLSPRFQLAANGEQALAELVPAAIPKVVRRLCAKADLDIATVDSFVFHQPSQFLHDTWTRRLKISAGQAHCNVRTNGCLVSASLPLALHDSIALGVVRPGHLLMLAGIGAGWAYGAQLWRINDIRIEISAEAQG